MISNIPPTGVLDIGSYQSKFIIFKTENNKTEILSKSILNTSGIKRGVISDLEKLTSTIKEIIGKAEDEAKLQISNIYVAASPLNNFSTSFCQSKNIGGYEIEHEKDVQFLINSGVSLFSDHNSECSIVHLFNLNLRIDRDNMVDNPVGLIADTLQNDMHIIYSKKNTIKNFQKAISKSYLKSEKFIFSPYTLSLLAYFESPLSDTIMTIDFGHEKTSLGIFSNDSFVFSRSIPIGSWHVTNDISKSLNLNFEIAENLKKNHSSCKVLIGEMIHEYVESENLGFKSYKKISNNILNKIVNSRVEEIVDFINKELVFFKSHKQIFNKILITGEGSKINGFYELLQEKLNIKSLTVEKFSSKLKVNMQDEFDVCLSVINFVQNPHNKEIPIYLKKKMGFFDKLYSLFN
jgi:cell division protein FtsA